MPRSTDMSVAEICSGSVRPRSLTSLEMTNRLFCCLFEQSEKSFLDLRLCPTQTDVGLSACSGSPPNGSFRSVDSAQSSLNCSFLTILTEPQLASPLLPVRLIINREISQPFTRTSAVADVHGTSIRCGGLALSRRKIGGTDATHERTRAN